MNDMLTGKDALIARLEDENARLRRELAEKDQQVEHDRKVVALGVTNLRRALSPLYTALQQVFGEFDGLGVDAVDAPTASGGVDAKVSAVWQAWKQRLPQSCGRVIDALLIHGGLTGPQICVAAKMSPNTLHGGTLTKLNKAGLLDKSGDRYSLKQL